LLQPIQIILHLNLYKFLLLLLSQFVVPLLNELQLYLINSFYQINQFKQYLYLLKLLLQLTNVFILFIYQLILLLLVQHLLILFLLYLFIM